ncbi:MAG: tetratricopeptide (TPR) repeat protein [Flavobacteriales bacterium]
MTTGVFTYLFDRAIIHFCIRLMKRILQTILSVLIPCLAMQNATGQADSQWNNFRSAESDSDRVKILLEIGYGLEMEQPDSAISVYKQAIELGTFGDYLIGVGRAQMYIGIVKSTAGDYTGSLESYREALKTFGLANYEMGVAGTHVNIGVVHNYRGEFEQAMESYMHGIRVYEAQNAKPQLISAYGNVGGIFIEMEQFEKGFSYFQKEMIIASEQGDSASIADAHINLGLGHQRLGRLDSALIHFGKCLAISEQSGLVYLEFLSHNNLSDLLAITDGAEKALPHATAAVRLSKLIGNPYNLVNAYKSVGVKLLELEEFDNANSFLDSSIQLAKTINSKDVLSESYMYLAESQAHQGAFEKAYESQRLYKLYADSVYSEDGLSRLNELEVAYESEKKDRAIAENSLELEKERKQSAIMVAGVIALILVIVFILIYFRQKQKLKDQEFEAFQREKEVAVVRSMLDGEEKERRRIARDLHDGLSAMLA